MFVVILVEIVLLPTICFYWLLLFAQTKLRDATIGVMVEENKPRAELSECKETHITTTICHLQEQGLVNKVVAEALEALQPTNTSNVIVNLMRELLVQHEGGVNNMIRKALRIVWSAQYSVEVKEIVEQWGIKMDKRALSFMTQSKVLLRHVDNIIIFGINEMLPLGRLDNFLFDTLKELLVSGYLNHTMMGVKQLRQLQQQDDISTAANYALRHLEDVLLEAFTELISNGELDDFLVTAVLEVLREGIFDGVISQTIMQLEEEVSLKNRSLLFSVNAKETRKSS